MQFKVFFFVVFMIKMDTECLDDRVTSNLKTDNVTNTTRKQPDTRSTTSVSAMVSLLLSVNSTTIEENTTSTKLIQYCENSTDLSGLTNKTVQYGLKTEAQQNDIYKEISLKLSFISNFILVPIVCPVGIIGNSIAAYVLVRMPANSSFVYMICILGADVLALISDFLAPVQVSLMASSTAWMAKVGNYLQYWNSDVINMWFRRFSLNIACVLSFERMMAISRPLHLQESITVVYSRSFIVVSAIVGISCSLIIPVSIQVKEIYDPVANLTRFPRVNTDIYNQNKSLISGLFFLSRVFTGPAQIFFFSVVNVMILRALKMNAKMRAKSGIVDRSGNMSKLQIKLCKIFLVLSASNIIGFLPSSIFIMANMSFSDMFINSPLFNLVVYGGHILRVLNSCSNFLVFLVLSKEIRNEFRKKCMCFQNKMSKQENCPADTNVISTKI